MSEVIVEFRHITKRFPRIVANDDINLSIRQGEIFALLGENGAGKSTLMSVLFGMYEPDEGEIWIRGKKETIDSPARATELSIGMVHQHFKLVSGYTIAENIVMGVEPRIKWGGFFPLVDIKTSNQQIADLSQKYGLDVTPTQRIDDADVSTQQRVEILKMLYREADILIFDEPTAVLPPQEVDFFLDILRSLQKNGKTIILITHKLEEIKKVANRCAVMRRGKLVSEALAVEGLTTQQMAHLMVGHELNAVAHPSEKNFGANVLEVHNLNVVSKEGVPLVKEVTFSVRQGEVFAIAGVFGNGQVELADAIAGVQPVISGSVLLNGEDISALSIRDRIEKGVAYIPEDRQRCGLILDFSLENNLILKSYYQKAFCHAGILDEDHITAYANELIDRYDIRSASGVNTIVRSMSGGNQQKAIIAREIELNGDLILFVQPTRGLDIGAIQNIHGKIMALRAQGKAIILISLELDEIMSCADTIGVIYNGALVHVEDRDNVTLERIGEWMMGVKEA